MTAAATAFDRLIADLRNNGQTVIDAGTTAKAQCPAHDDTNPSLSITAIEGRVLICCHAGCTCDAIVNSLGRTMADLFDNSRGADYLYPDGRDVHRTPTKQFSQKGNTKGTALFRADKITEEIHTVYVVEGEQDVLAVEAVGGVAVCNAMGAGKAHLFDWSPLKGKHVLIVQDRDDPGRSHAAEVAAILEPIAESVQIMQAAVGKDTADHIAAGKTLDDFVEVESELLADVKSAAALDDMTFAELVEHVPNLIHEGFGVLAGSPKVGKSWMAIAIALACAQGGRVFGCIKVEPRAVLLLALEDGERRLQKRMWILNGDDPLPERLDYLTVVQPGEVMPTIKAWLQRHRNDKDPPLVIVDTFGKVRPQRKPGEDPYIADYQIGSYIKRAADRIPGAAILVIHHDRKMGSDDWLKTVAGTQGVTGSADYILLLARKRKSSEGLLSVTSRDVREDEYAMLLTGEGVWKLDGGSFDTAAEKADERIERGKLDERAFKVLTFVNSRKETRAEDLQPLGFGAPTATVYLARLASSGRIDRIKRGVYGPVGDESDQSDDAENDVEPPKERVRSVISNEENNTYNTPNTHSFIDDKPRCKHCGDPLMHPESITRGYCAKQKCLLEAQNPNIPLPPPLPVLLVVVWAVVRGRRRKPRPRLGRRLAGRAVRCRRSRRGTLTPRYRSRATPGNGSKRGRERPGRTGPTGRVLRHPTSSRE
ncbi:AAA family ATPase [Mycobacterium sp.]|uniref:AAA family ATPase n=1 Tax=Mycobacterium sp. TaxID=1785 RepID=UPI003F9DEFC4